jgi:hypothetical protein
MEDRHGPRVVTRVRIGAVSMFVQPDEMQLTLFTPLEE